MEVSDTVSPFLFCSPLPGAALPPRKNPGFPGHSFTWHAHMPQKHKDLFASSQQHKNKLSSALPYWGPEQMETAPGEAEGAAASLRKDLSSHLASASLCLMQMSEDRNSKQKAFNFQTHHGWFSPDKPNFLLHGFLGHISKTQFATLKTCDLFSEYHSINEEPVFIQKHFSPKE